MVRTTFTEPVSILANLSPSASATEHDNGDGLQYTLSPLLKARGYGRRSGAFAVKERVGVPRAPGGPPLSSALVRCQ